MVCAVSDPLDLLLIDNLKTLCRCELKFYIATRADLINEIQEFYTRSTFQQVQKLSRPEEALTIATTDEVQPSTEVAAATRMFNVKFVRENPEIYHQGLQKKGVEADVEEILSLDKQRRTIRAEIDSLRAKKNDGDNRMKKLMASEHGPDTEAKRNDIIEEMVEVSHQIDHLEPQVKSIENRLAVILIGLPNIPHESVPAGGANKNVEVRRWGSPKLFGFELRDHIELGERLDIIDFKRATKISGSNFIVFKNAGARLERALINFMLDLHTREHGYQEILPPYLVNPGAMTGTGQLPKMKDDMYLLEGDNLYLIPTAEVPVTNLHAEEMLSENALPVCYAAYSACFRREAGSYGKDTRGLIRVHQFDKVELVRFVKPEDSYAELEKLVSHAEKVLQMLELPYRVVELASGDLSFASSKCYDLEVHAAGLDRWLEVSSCSNFEDFQARRANIRFKRRDGSKPDYVHTLNGSGLALARTVIAILENYQNREGAVMIPKVLQPYMGGMEKISKQL